MHRDMKRELQAQKVDTQSEIDEWVKIFNFEGPHQALQGDTLAEHYHKSSRKYKGSLVEIDYGKMPTRIIGSHGDLKWHGVDYFLSEALRGERVGIAKIGEERYEVWFDVLLLGILDKGKRVFHPRREEKGKEGDLILGRPRQRAKIREVDWLVQRKREEKRNFTRRQNSAIRGAAKVLPMWVNYRGGRSPPPKAAQDSAPGAFALIEHLQHEIA